MGQKKCNDQLGNKGELANDSKGKKLPGRHGWGAAPTLED